MTDFPIIHCEGCNTVLRGQANFCTQCGRRVNRSNYSPEQSRALRFGGVFLVILILLSGTYSTQAEGWDYLTRMYFEFGIFGSSLIFFLLNINEGKRLIGFKGIKARRILQAVAIGIPSAILVSHGIGYINQVLSGIEGDYYYYWYADFPYPKLAVFVFLAVGPALFEELAFRSFLFNQLRRFFTPKVTIIISAFFFALVHFSLVSILWIFPFGLFLGYLRWKYNTIWYGVALHFTHNFVVGLLELVELELLF